VNPLAHYLRPEVSREIVEWLRGRWVALEGIDRDGKRLFVRYDSRGKPLRFSDVKEFQNTLLRYGGRIRTVYGSINIYGKLECEVDTEVLPNIIASTPSWDIDASLDQWKLAIEAAKVIVEVLERYGVSKSVYLVWSGEGVHVHVNENALSPEARAKIHPFDAAYAVVEYVLREARPKLLDLVKQSQGILKVENVVDLKRVFTAPLSLHRKHDVVAVCFSPNDLDSFDIEWTKPDSYKHKPAWKEYVVGELDELAEKAVKEIGLRSLQLGVTRVKRSSISIEDVLTQPEEIKIGRFEVMALLQAARYYLLTGDLEKAKSFGLNRAIFYAYLKYYGPHGRRRASATPQALGFKPVREGVEEKKFVKVFGTEEVPVSPRGWFVMGDQEQLPEDFDRQIKSKLEVVAPWDVIWKAAIDYVSKFPKHILKDPQKFYEYVYLPVRDSFFEKVLKKQIEGKKGKTLFDFGKKSSQEKENKSAS